MYDPAAGYARSNQESQQPVYHFTPGMDAAGKEASNKRALAQQKKHNDAQYSDGLFGLDDVKQAGQLGWESFKTEMYDEWSPVGNVIEWGAKNILPWNWFNKDTSMSAIRARSRQRYKEMEAADTALGDKYGFTPGQQAIMRVGAGLGVSLLDPVSIGLMVATGGYGAGIIAGVKAAKSGRSIARAVKIARKAAKMARSANELNQFRRVYGGVTRAEAEANRAGMGLLRRGWRNVTRGKLGREIMTEGLEWGLIPSTGADRSHTVYRGNDGLLYQKDPEILRSALYNTIWRGSRNPNERGLGYDNTAMLDYMAKQYGMSAEDLYSELSRRGITPEQAYQYAMADDAGYTYY